MSGTGCQNCPHALLASRRAVLAAAGLAAALTGCQAYSSGSTGSAGSDPARAPRNSGARLASLQEIPVGGGKIIADQNVVVVRPDRSTVQAFSATCTHAGCRVTDVSDGTINCACHGSKFALSDGSVVGGPAPRPLPPAPVTVTGDTITLG